MAKEPTTIGLSVVGHQKLKKLKEDGQFREMVDAYRFAIALALAYGAKPKITRGERTTYLNVGSLDKDGSLYAAISALREDEQEPVWQTAEGLAEWGVEELDKLSEGGDIAFGELLIEAEKLRKI